MANHVDVLIIGAGISGVSTAWHLQKHCPQKTYAILERRARSGGTWDLFRYPGIRSDSDMYTLGFAFKPWKEKKAIADGPSILAYVNETIRENRIDEKIHFGRHVKAACWSSRENLWRLDVEMEETGKTEQWTCGFVAFCAGYYHYGAGYTPDFEGRNKFQGEIVHPQHWPQQLQCAGKKIVVIGSGATAVTLVPEIARLGAQVTMLQRSPTYMVSRPSEDAIANFLQKILPAKLAYGLVRWRNVYVQLYFYRMSQWFPKLIKSRLLAWLRKELPDDYDVKTHFTPTYNPWAQRLCLVPDGDFFKAVSDGSASIVTDHVASFTENGMRLKSGAELEADIIITATGLNMKFLGGIDVSVDGDKVDPGQMMIYRGAMCEGVPNMCFIFGYTNASWTLKADLTAQYLCRLVNHMDGNDMVSCTPHCSDPAMEQKPFVNFTSGYFARAQDRLPKQGAKKPWKLNQNYALDILALRYGRLEDGVLQFKAAGDDPIAHDPARDDAHFKAAQ